MAKKKRTFGVSPKGALVLREREQERRANLPRVAVRPDGATYRLPQNPLVALMREFPLLTADIKGEFMPVPEIWPGTAIVIDAPKCIEVAINMSHLNDLPICLPINLPEPKPGIPPLITHTFVETDHSESPVHRFLEQWWPELGMPFEIRPESEAPDRKKYKLRKADARAVVASTDNSYRDFCDTIQSWYSKDAEHREYRRYAIEEKLCDKLDKVAKYFSDFKDRSGTRLSGLDITIGLANDEQFKLLVTEVFDQRQAMLLLEVVTNIPNMRPLGYARFFKDPVMGLACSEDRMYNIYFNDVDVFGRDQLDQFLDIVAYCLDQGLVKEYISYYG